MVDWLFHHVEGFSDRREARKYASNLLKAGYIRHTVNKITFSEQCYYIFGDLCGSKWALNCTKCTVTSNKFKCDDSLYVVLKADQIKSSPPLIFSSSIHPDMTHLSLHDHDGSSGGASDQDTLHPLPHPGAAPWPMTLPYQFPIPHPYDLPQPFHGGPGAGSAGSQHSGRCTENSLRVVKTFLDTETRTM